MNNTLKYLSIALFALSLTGCEKGANTPSSSNDSTPGVDIVLPKADGPLDEIGVETMKTEAISSLNNVGFSLKVSDKKIPVEYGIAYSTNLSDLKRRTAWRKKGTSVKDGVCAVKLDLLYTGATYYYAAYSIVEGSCYYGEVKSLNTPKASVGTSVNLGLTVDWSDRNLGANSPFERGNFYYWQEATPAGTTPLSGKVKDISEISGSESDPAFKEWGGRWRLPTSKEIQDLAWKCDWELVTIEGQQVFKVSYPLNKDLYIYVPFTGFMLEGDNNPHEDYLPTIVREDEVHILSGSQVDNKTNIDGSKDLSWCHALEYNLFDYNQSKKPSVPEYSPKSYRYVVRPVYEPIIIN